MKLSVFSRLGIAAIVGAFAIAALPAQDLEWKSDTSPFSFREYFNGGWAVQKYKWIADRLTNKIVTQKTGVTVDRYFPTGNDNDYLNLMIASDDLPDVLHVEWNNPITQKLIKSGRIVPISDLIAKFAPKFASLLDPEMVKYHSVDGKLWYLPNYYVTKSALANGVPVFGGIRPFFARKDIYEALGKPKLETPDQWIAFLKAAKAKFPDVKGIGFEYFDVNKWGFGGSTSTAAIIQAFAPELQGWENNQSFGQFTKTGFTYAVRNANYVEAIKFVNRLFREGFFDPQLLIYKEEQWEEKQNNASFALSSAWVSNVYTRYNPVIEKALGPAKTYVFPGVFKVPGKVPQYPSQRLMGWMGTFVTTKAKNPERIIKYLEYAWSDEGQLDFRVGNPGETYTMADGVPLVKSEIVALSKSDNAKYDTTYGFEDSTLIWKTGGVWDKMAVRDMKKDWPDQFATYSTLAAYAVDSYGSGLDGIEPDPSTPEGVVHAKVKDIWSRVLAKMILAKNDAEFQAAYKDGISQIDRVGAARAEKAIFDLHVKDLSKKGLKP